VRPSAAFVARELSGRRGCFAYRVREHPHMRVAVRHGSADPVTLGEVFHERDYAPPAALGAIEPRQILDLGANVGYFGALALSVWPRASVLAYEPDPRNAAVHLRTIGLNGLGERWTLRRAAATAAEGEVRFRASGNALSQLDPDGELAVPAEDVLPLMAESDLVKIDIEGGEWAILGDPRFAAAPPPVVVLEHHPLGAPGADPARAARERLAAAGLTASASIFQRADGCGMLWAWRP
jgi:FkbM family methyltransferase